MIGIKLRQMLENVGYLQKRHAADVQITFWWR